jgi:membrane protease YdiL (CAAX protease family)
MKNKLTFAALLIFIGAVSVLAYFTSTSNIENNVILHSTFYFLIPFSVALGLKLKPKNIGLSIKRSRRIVFYSAVLITLSIPVMSYAATLPEFNAYYPRFFAPNLGTFAYYEGLLLISFAAFEFFFRGFALFQLRSFVGDWPAILIHNIPYTLVHIGKPGLEIPYSFLAGLVFGYIAIKSKSFLPAFASHYTTSVIFDFLNW